MRIVWSHSWVNNVSHWMYLLVIFKKKIRKIYTKVVSKWLGYRFILIIINSYITYIQKLTKQKQKNHYFHDIEKYKISRRSWCGIVNNSLLANFPWSTAEWEPRSRHTALEDLPQRALACLDAPNPWRLLLTIQIPSKRLLFLHQHRSTEQPSTGG